GLLLRLRQARAQPGLLPDPRRPLGGERAHAALQLFGLARLAGAAALRILDLLAAIAAAALVAVDRQRQLAQARAGALQRGLRVVESPAAGLHLRLLGVERDRRRLLAARLVGEARGERARLLLQLEEVAAEQHALHGDHLGAQHAVAP